MSVFLNVSCHDHRWGATELLHLEKNKKKSGKSVHEKLIKLTMDVINCLVSGLVHEIKSPLRDQRQVRGEK